MCVVCSYVGGQAWLSATWAAEDLEEYLAERCGALVLFPDAPRCPSDDSGGPTSGLAALRSVPGGGSDSGGGGDSGERSHEWLDRCDEAKGLF